MKATFPLAVVFACLCIPTLTVAQSSTTTKPRTKVIVPVKDAKGNDVGTVKLKDLGDQGVEVELKLKNLSPGEHALHFHQNAKCEAPDFKSAGPHFNPSGKHHGLENAEGPHEGDMQNITVKADGTCDTEFVNPRVRLADPAIKNSLYTNGGTAVVIHAKADDMKSDPAGNAGDRIACGVITAQ
ncbi:MAG TPA: superoxide dismutase family protein [candidate division Zixibacteria bacterium]|nr:superoxide dismutase family protein [candidate division Zixibacteria bacterium]